jgi:hypothetical protein
MGFFLLARPPKIDSLSGPDKKSISFPNNHLSICVGLVGQNYIIVYRTGPFFCIFQHQSRSSKLHLFSLQLERSPQIKDGRFAVRDFWVLTRITFSNNNDLWLPGFDVS